MTRLRDLPVRKDGATIVEFALVAPFLVLLIFGVIDGSRMFWMKKSMDEVAFSTARCMAISSQCDEAGEPAAYAVRRAQSYGIRITATDVTAETDALCRNQSGSISVSIAVPLVSAARGLVPLPETLTSSACFPDLSPPEPSGTPS